MLNLYYILILINFQVIYLTGGWRGGKRALVYKNFLCYSGPHLNE